jgi:5-methylcytosine-specific restriction endonuclease McrA
MSKKCTKCGELKDLGEFSKDKSKSCGRRPSCKLCERKRVSEYKSKNPERVLESGRKYRAKPSNKEKTAEYNKDYYVQNSEKIKERTKSWAENNKDKKRASDSRYSLENRSKLRENHKRWMAENPEKGREYLNRRRALSASCDGNFTATQWQARLDYYGGQCVYCGSEDKIEIEHRIPLSRGGTNWPANLVPACKSCNCKKSTKTETEFKLLLNKEA